MSDPALAPAARRTAGWSVAALGLSIPISTAADGILTVLVLLGAAISFDDSRRAIACAARRIPPVTAAAALFVWLLVACAWSSAPPREAFATLGKYLDLVLIPVFLWAAMDARIRRSALVCFTIAVMLNLYVSYSAAAGLPGLRSPAYPIGFKASVTHSLVVSLGAFLLLLYAREARSTGWRIALVALAAVCAHNVLFVVIGRTGYVVLGLLVAYYVMSFFRGWRAPAIASAVVLALAASAYFASANLQKRVDEIGSDIAQWRPGSRDETSVGQRLEYYRTTLAIVADHPLLGTGTGGFARAYAQRVEGTGARTTVNPHNDYLMIAAQTGLPGVVLLLTLYAAMWRSAVDLESRLACHFARGLVIAMAVGGLFNSLLLDHTEGLLFAWATAVLYGGFGPSNASQESCA